MLPFACDSRERGRAEAITLSEKRKRKRKRKRKKRDREREGEGEEERKRSQGEKTRGIAPFLPSCGLVVVVARKHSNAKRYNSQSGQ